MDRIGQKVIEEAGETVIAGVKLDKDALAREAADLLYHLLVLLSANGGKPEDIYTHLRERRKVVRRVLLEGFTRSISD